MPKPTPVLVWFRRDLRLADNPALSAAAKGGRPIVPIFILDEETTGTRPLGGASRWWLHQSLAALAIDLSRRGVRLVLRRGPAAEVLNGLVAETGADAVFWNRRYDPASVARDRGIKRALTERGITVESFNASLLAEPWHVATKAGKPFSVFTPFWKALQDAVAPDAPLPAPEKIAGPAGPIAGDTLDDWRLLPTEPDWAAGFRAALDSRRGWRAPALRRLSRSSARGLRGPARHPE